MTYCREQIPVVNLIRPWVDGLPEIFLPISLGTRRPQCVMPTIFKGSTKWSKVNVHSDTSFGNMGRTNGIIDIWREKGGASKHIHATLLPTFGNDYIEAVMAGAMDEIVKGNKSYGEEDDQIRRKCIAMANDYIRAQISSAGPLSIGNEKIEIGKVAEFSKEGTSILGKPIRAQDENKWLGSGRGRYRVTRKESGIHLEFLTGATGSKLIFHCIDIASQDYNELINKLDDAANSHTLNADSIRDYLNPYFKTENPHYIPDLKI